MGRRILTTLRRTAIHAGPTVLGIIVLDFLLLQLMPGDAADVMASESGVATAETMAALRERFGLTHAEARVAVRVGRGDAPKHVAAELAVSYYTVRAQLREIFAKTGVRRQAQLAELVAREQI